MQCWAKSSTSCGKTVSNSFSETGLNSKSERGAFEAMDAARFGSRDGSQLLRIDARIGALVLMVNCGNRVLDLEFADWIIIAVRGEISSRDTRSAAPSQL